MDPSGASLVPPPGLNFLRILANSTSIRLDSSSLDLALRRSVMKLLRPRACVDDMIYLLCWLDLCLHKGYQWYVGLGVCFIFKGDVFCFSFFCFFESVSLFYRGIFDGVYLLPCN